MNNVSENVTGDHAEMLAVTRSEKKNFFENFPNKTQEAIGPHLKMSNGLDNPENWLNTITEFIKINSFSIKTAFDFLLTEDAKELWMDIRKDLITDDDAMEWFKTTYFVRISIVEDIVKLANVEQKTYEKFLNFELRIRIMVEAIKNSPLSVEEVTKTFVAKRIHNEILKHDFAINPEVSGDEMRQKAVNYEKNYLSMEKKTTIEKPAFVQVIRNGNNFN